MSDLYPTAGCRIYIGGTISIQADDFAMSDFDGETWVEIDPWLQMGDLADVAELISTPAINRGRNIKQKGTLNAGGMQNVFGFKSDDTGQIALIAASKTRSNYAFRIVINDTPTGSSPTPSERLFVALVMNVDETGGGANELRKLNATLEVNSNFVTVAAATGD